MTALLLTVLFLIVAAIAGLILLSVTARRSYQPGVRNGLLAACPDSPNCVCTQADDATHWIEPFTRSATAEQTLNSLIRIIESMPGARIVDRNDTWIYAEFRSPIFRFVDDVEFFVEPNSSHVHFRSSSRAGYSDLGVNRARMERIRNAFMQVQHEVGASVLERLDYGSVASLGETRLR